LEGDLAASVDQFSLLNGYAGPQNGECRAAAAVLSNIQGMFAPERSTPMHYSISQENHAHA
jgi:hypothetical protein